MSPNPSIAFDESHHAIGAVDFDYPQDEPTTERELSAAERQEILTRTLQFLTGQNAKAAHIGKRVLLLAHLVGKSRCRTQRELAKRLGYTEGRASQALKVARAELAMLARVSSAPAQGN